MGKHTWRQVRLKCNAGDLFTPPHAINGPARVVPWQIGLSLVPLDLCFRLFLELRAADVIKFSRIRARNSFLEPRELLLFRDLYIFATRIGTSAEIPFAPTPRDVQGIPFALKTFKIPPSGPAESPDGIGQSMFLGLAHQVHPTCGGKLLESSNPFGAEFCA
jgi:hypothetical protein